eukprot:14302610-Alexandrium_andersonii.AAC.1
MPPAAPAAPPEPDQRPPARQSQQLLQRHPHVHHHSNPECSSATDFTRYAMSNTSSATKTPNGTNTTPVAI